ncbi:substrate-binding domain-containing protein, partial [Rhizobiaceae sp. 2RAB30]
RRTLRNCERAFGEMRPLIFVGGRGTDHNTSERVRGFRAAHEDMGVPVDDTHILTCGYAPEKAERALSKLVENGAPLPQGMFVNSTISLEGVLRWTRRRRLEGPFEPVLGCFDWDPVVQLLDDRIEMVRQDVPSMLQAIFEIIESGAAGEGVIQVPTLFFGNGSPVEA